ncbi:MAG: glycosyltransferase, partial [Donghicola eburneus]
ADLDRYDLSNGNRAKIVPTLLSNQLLRMSWRFKERNTQFTLPKYGYEHEKTHDVYFSGKLGPNRFDNRVHAWERVTADLGDLRLKGGLASNGQVEVPAHLKGELMEKPEYLNTLLTTKVNLALSGIGPFTHRHLELFYAGAFALSNNDIEPLWLRAPVVKGQDYAAFDTEDEMIDMIRYYVAHDAEREAIAKNGRACFERLYDVPAHAVELRDALQKVI